MSVSLPTAETSALIVVDIQERLAQAMPPRHVDGNVRRAAKLIRAAQKLHIPVLVTEQYRKGLGATLPIIAEACGQDFVAIEKLNFDCFGCEAFATAWQQAGRTHAVIVGMETHVCVTQTALSAAARGSATVVGDAVVSRYSDDHVIALDFLRSAGIGVASFEMVLFAWMQAAGTPAFKELSHLARERD